MSAQIVIVCDGCSGVMAQGASIGAARRDVTDGGGQHVGTDTDLCAYCIEVGKTGKP